MPILDDPTPELDLITGTLTFDFDETIDVSEINLDGITITNSSGGNPTILTGSITSNDDLIL